MAIAARIEAALGRGVILRDERGRATLHDADVDISGPKYVCIRSPAPGVRFIPRLVAKASGAGTLVLSEGAEVVPVGTSTAITLVNELRTDIMAHAARTNRHTTAVQDATGAPDAADDTESLLALTNWLTEFYTAHDADATLEDEWQYHSAQGTANALTSTAPVTTIPGAVVRLNDIKAKFNAHEALIEPHNSVDSVTGDQIAADDAALTAGKDYGTAFTTHYRITRTSVRGTGAYFWEDPEIIDAGTTLDTRRVLADAPETVGVFEAKPDTSYLVKFTPDADNTKLWLEFEYDEVR